MKRGEILAKMLSDLDECKNEEMKRMYLEKDFDIEDF